MLVASELGYLIHWPTQGGYNFVSGPLADSTLATAFGSALYVFLRKHNCHVQGCWRMAWHPHPAGADLDDPHDFGRAVSRVDRRLHVTRVRA